jgi:transposase
MLAGLVHGETDPMLLAQLARGRMQHKRVELERALSARIGPHQRFLLQEQLALVDSVEASIQRVNDEIARRLQPHGDLFERLDEIPGIGPRIIQIVLAEIGPDVRRFPSAAHLASWAGLCPGNHESAGHQRTGRTRKGNPWLRTALVEAAQAAARVKSSYLGAQFRRLAARRGVKRALVAVAHSLLVIIYSLLTRGSTYADLGTGFFDQRDRQHTTTRLVARLQRLGYQVNLDLAAPTG